jgi:uncharacterized protein DUF6448
MPPHCDSMDGPVVVAARRALDAGDVALVLPFVHEEGEAEVREAFERAARARAHGGEAREVADLYMFETVVRVHRAGEGAPFTGLKPAGLDVGPVIPVAEASIEAGAVEGLAAFLSEAVRREANDRFDAMVAAKVSADAGVAAARAYVEAMLGLQVWAHRLYGAIHAPAHGGAGGHGHG